MQSTTARLHLHLVLHGGTDSARERVHRRGGLFAGALSTAEHLRSVITRRIVVLCAALIAVIILAYLKPLRDMYSRVVSAETWKAAALGETVVGIKTVKALALEPQRRAQWDERVAETGKWRLEFARLSNWPLDTSEPDRAVHDHGHIDARGLLGDG